MTPSLNTLPAAAGTPIPSAKAPASAKRCPLPWATLPAHVLVRDSPHPGDPVFRAPAPPPSSPTRDRWQRSGPARPSADRYW